MRSNSSASSKRMWCTSIRHDLIKGSTSRSPKHRDHLVPFRSKEAGWLLSPSWLGCTMITKRLLLKEGKTESTIRSRVEVCQDNVVICEDSWEGRPSVLHPRGFP